MLTSGIETPNGKFLFCYTSDCVHEWFPRDAVLHLQNSNWCVSSSTCMEIIIKQRNMELA